MSPIYTPGKLTMRKSFVPESYMYEFPSLYPIWTPANITTAVWLDAADSGTLITVSGAVSQWNDKSGNSRNAVQITAGNRPTYSLSGLNNRPSLLSTRAGSTKMSFSSFPSIGNQLHIFAAVNAANSGDYQYLFGTNPGAEIGIVLRTSGLSEDWQTGDALSFGRGFEAANNPRSIGPVTWSGPSVFYSALGTTTSTTELNATRISTRVQGTSALSMSSSLPALFANASTGAQFLEGALSEFIMVLGSMTSTVKQKLEGYLAHKWGLTANLPSDHPYKIVGPTP